MLMPLLADAVATKTLSGAPTDFKMHTHCSGTDNVSIALELGAELARANDLDAFAPEHLLSCEIEPFKQAYIARNFPQVVVSPDVSLLAKTKTGEKFQTIYRGEQVVPPCDVLVGGSSCKDFSNLKMRYHVSGLEDEGQSGTTFRAIVNNMFKDGNDGPKLVILENVNMPSVVSAITAMVLGIGGYRWHGAVLTPEEHAGAPVRWFARTLWRRSKSRTPSGASRLS